MFRLTRIVVCLTLLSLVGCAGLEPNFETPTVAVSSFQVLPSTGIAPRFEIILHIINPNRSPLTLDGVVYSVSLEGHKVLMGVANQLPVIEGYGEGEVVLNATADLFGSFGLLTSLMQAPQDSFSYELDAKLDIGSFRPKLHVVKQGEINLQGGVR